MVFLCAERRAKDDGASSVASSPAAAGNGSGSTAQSAGALLSARPGGMAHTLDQVDKARKMVGVDDQGLDLPGIAVIGGQSAGKSSVVELLSGISLPRCGFFLQFTSIQWPLPV